MRKLYSQMGLNSVPVLLYSLILGAAEKLKVYEKKGSIIYGFNTDSRIVSAILKANMYL